MKAESIKWIHLGQMEYFWFMIPDPEAPNTAAVQVTVIRSRAKSHATLIGMIHYRDRVWKKSINAEGKSLANALNKLLSVRTGVVWVARVFHDAGRPTYEAMPMTSKVKKPKKPRARGMTARERADYMRELMRKRRAAQPKEKARKSLFGPPVTFDKL